MEFDFLVPQYRTVDVDDALDDAYDHAVAVMNELEPVTVLTEDQKKFAAEYIGQRFLDQIAYEETTKLLKGLTQVVDGLAKPYLVMVSIPSDAGVNHG